MLNIFTISVIYAAAGDIVGQIAPPANLPASVNLTTATVFSKIIYFLVAVAGIYSLWQFITGGLDFITSGGDKGKVQQATQKITMSILGLVVIAASFVIIAIIGFLFFGDTSTFINPKLETL